MLIQDSELIFQCKDEYGSIEVVDYKQLMRSLHFGNKTQQSTMLLCNPHFLIHKYTQAMMLPTCWLNLNNALILGLGSGSIAKYLYKQFPDAFIDTVELRKKVIDIAYEFFLIPDQSERFTIHNLSVFDWLDKTNTDKKYDLIIVDLFLTESGSDKTIDISHYIRTLKNILSDKGVIVCNQLGGSYKDYSAYEALCDYFPNNVHYIDIESTNSILLASNSNIPKQESKYQLSDETLQECTEKHSLPYIDYYRLLRKPS